MPTDKLGDLIESLNRDAKTLKEQIMDVCVFMGGGVDLNAAWAMSFEDRQLAIKSINKKMRQENPNAKEYM